MFVSLAASVAAAAAGGVQEQPLQPAHAATRDCRSRHGVAEVRAIGPDCEELAGAAAGDPVRVEFPMKTLTVQFPCAEPFSAVPLVMITILGENTNKLYASSLRNVTTSGFTFNVQRVDDVPEPDMSCHPLRLSYIATSDFLADESYR